MLFKCRFIFPVELASSWNPGMCTFNKFSSPWGNQLCTSHLIRKLERTRRSRKGCLSSAACQAVLIFVMRLDHYHLPADTVFIHKVKVKSLSRVQLFATPWIVAYQASPSMGFSRQKYQSGLPFPSPGYLPGPGIKPRSPSLPADTLPSEPPGKPPGIFK